jgi:hemerythrin-like domain-containing protein
MNAIDFLKKEHKKAKAGLKKIEQASATQRRHLWAALAPELKLHEQLEETYFYGPLAAEAGVDDRTLGNWAQEHEQQVHEAESLIETISSLSPSDPGWLASIRELETVLGQHIKVEEQEIWPRARKAWDEAKLDDAGRRMEHRHEEAA